MPDLPSTVLVIEDEPALRRVLRTTLLASGYQVMEAATAQEGLAQVERHQPALILLDLGLPDLDGLEVTRRVRAWATIPIIILSVRDREADKITALDAGANDYLTKPFSMGELLARIRVALRQIVPTAPELSPPVFMVGPLRVDCVRRQVLVAEQPVHLTPTEYKLLAILVRHAGQVVTHRQLLHEVWGADTTHEIQYLWVYMSQLRHKLEVDPARPRYLLTEPGIGYRLKTD
jgi:two-component system KDP operon response regulator KdpE